MENNTKQPENGIIPVIREQNYGCLCGLAYTAFLLVGAFTQNEEKQLLAVIMIGLFFTVLSLIPLAWKKLTRISFSDIGVYIGDRLYEWSELTAVRIAQDGKIRLYIGGKQRGTCFLKDTNAQQLLEYAEKHGMQVQKER